MPEIPEPGSSPTCDTAGILDAAGLSTIDQVSQTPADLLSLARDEHAPAAVRRRCVEVLSRFAPLHDDDGAHVIH